MMTVKEVSERTGVSIRTLQYYDGIGLLKPVKYTESGYRLYDDTALERLQQILLFRELEFPLKEIKRIIDAPNFDRKRALEQQIALLVLKKEHISRLITFARNIKNEGEKEMDFSVFDTGKIEEYEKRAREEWGNTSAYQEYEERNKNGTLEKEKISAEFMKLFAELGKEKESDPAEERVQAGIKGIQQYITEHFYNCTDEIFAGLGQMYGNGGEFTENIDRAGGKGTAKFIAKAIEIYIKGKNK